jgi:hypothetical protein
LSIFPYRTTLGNSKYSPAFNRAQQLLVFGDDVHLFSENLNTLQKNTEASLDAG